MKIDPADLDWREAHTLAVGAIVPRPIAFVSTIGEDGVFNVAPFSFFSPMANKPMLLGFTAATTKDGRKKDTLVNIESSRDFVLNVVTESLAEAMNQTAMSYPSDVDEFKEAGLIPVAADIVRPPMVGESPVNMECRLVQVLEFKNPPMISSFIIGEIIRVHIKDEFYADGAIQMSELKAIGRMGGDSYCRTRDIFEMKRPD